MPNETVTLQQRIDRVIKDADVAFWAVIAKEFPEIKTGDFFPDQHFIFLQAQEKAVKQWIKNNKPQYNP